MSKSCFYFYFSPKLATPSPFFATLPQAPFLRHQSSAAFRLSPVFVSLERAKRPTVIHFLCSWPFLVSIFSCPQQLNRWPCRGHDNIHDDMIMYVIHTWSILIIVMNRWEIMHIWIIIVHTCMINHLFIAMINFDHVWICWSLHHIVTPKITVFEYVQYAPQSIAMAARSCWDFQSAHVVVITQTSICRSQYLSVYIVQ